VARLQPLPLGHLRRRLVLLRAEHRRRLARELRRELVPHVLAQHRRHVGLVGEVALGARVAAAVAHVHEVRQRLRARGALVEVGALAAERVRRDHGLRAEARLAHRAAEFDLLQRGHRACSCGRLSGAASARLPADPCGIGGGVVERCKCCAGFGLRATAGRAVRRRPVLCQRRSGPSHAVTERRASRSAPVPTLFRAARVSSRAPARRVPAPARAAPTLPSPSMLINLLPDFLAVLESGPRPRRGLPPLLRGAPPAARRVLGQLRRRPRRRRTSTRSCAPWSRPSATTCARCSPRSTWSALADDAHERARALLESRRRPTWWSWSASARPTRASSWSTAAASRSSASSTSPASPTRARRGSASTRSSSRSGSRTRRARGALHLAREPQRAARARARGRRLLLVLGDRAPRAAARAPRQRGARRRGLAPRSRRATRRGSTSATAAASTRACASSSRARPRRRPRARRGGARPAPALALGRHERRGAHGRPLRHPRARRLLRGRPLVEPAVAARGAAWAVRASAEELRGERAQRRRPRRRRAAQVHARPGRRVGAHAARVAERLVPERRRTAAAPPPPAPAPTPPPTSASTTPAARAEPGRRRPRPCRPAGPPCAPARATPPPRPRRRAPPRRRCAPRAGAPPAPAPT
jgi:hypothetical protein